MKMKQCIEKLLVAVVLLALSLPLSHSSGASFVKKWQHNWNGSGNWNIKDNWTRGCCLGVYNKEMVNVSTGKVRVRASGVDDGNYRYQSGWVDTNGKKSYGVNHSFRGRCKITNRYNGVNYGFWLLRQGGPWPPEIDIYEFPYAVDQGGSRYKFTVHYTSNGHKSAGKWRTGVTHTNWANYRIDWWSGSIRGYYNNVQFKSVTTAAAIPTGQMYLILSTVVNNNTSWHGTPGSNNWGPAEQVCDYVQVFKWQ